MKENPYAAPPTEEADDLTNATSEEVPLSGIAKPIFLDWEYLRLVYNAILVLITLGLISFQPHLLGDLEFMVSVLFGAVVANLCFFLGPAVETYIAWLGFRNLALRLFLFISGTLVAVVLAFFSVLLYDFPLPSQN